MRGDDGIRRESQTAITPIDIKVPEEAFQFLELCQAKAEELTGALPVSKWPLEADSIGLYSNNGLTYLGSVSRATAEAMERGEIQGELEQMKRAADRNLAALWIGFLCVVTILLFTLG